VAGVTSVAPTFTTRERPARGIKILSNVPTPALPGGQTARLAVLLDALDGVGDHPRSAAGERLLASEQCEVDARRRAMRGGPVKPSR
jgi:hypothetical protein